MRLSVVFVAALCGLSAVSAIYLPGVAPKEYTQGEQVAALEG